MEFVKILLFITVDIFKHTAKKNKKIKRADQILPEVYGTTLNYLAYKYFGFDRSYLMKVIPIGYLRVYGLQPSNVRIEDLWFS